MALRGARLQTSVARGQGCQLEPCGLPAQLCCQGACLALQMGAAEIPTETALAGVERMSQEPTLSPYGGPTPREQAGLG